jgi:hypothetical protein
MPGLSILRSLPFLGFALALAAAPAKAEVAEVAGLTYDVYLGGLHIFTFDVNMNLRPDGYQVDAAGGTQGMIGWLYDWQMKLAAEGKDSHGRIEAHSYTVASDWKQTPRITDLTFGADGTYDLQQSPPPEPDPDIEGSLPATLPPGTLDPLSLAVAASRTLAETGSCNQTVPVFDGRRRFDLTVKQIGPAVLEPNEYSIYQGDAIRCSFSLKRISGFRKSWKSSRQWDAGSEAPPTIWMAEIQPGLPPLPVRYEGTIALGSIVVHLTKAQLRKAPGGGMPEAEAD